MKIFGVRTRLENRINKRVFDVRRLANMYNLDMDDRLENLVRLYTPAVALSYYMFLYRRDLFFRLPFSYIKKLYNFMNRGVKNEKE